ncbi:MAG: hypothetical protein V7640_2939 [Betaproteobacteria bacterium]
MRMTVIRALFVNAPRAGKCCRPIALQVGFRPSCAAEGVRRLDLANSLHRSTRGLSLGACTSEDVGGALAELVVKHALQLFFGVRALELGKLEQDAELIQQHRRIDRLAQVRVGARAEPSRTILMTCGTGAKDHRPIRIGLANLAA